MKLEEKREREKIINKVGHFVNVISPLTKENIKNKILNETVDKVLKNELNSDSEIKEYIKNRDRYYATQKDLFKILLKISPLVLILFLIFIVVYQTFFL